jgi:transcriptional regulator with XRE-family HTH domain
MPASATVSTVESDLDLPRRRELAQFLRTAREALDPAEAGAGANPRRRVKGWLREEVAFAAGISATWYMWLEQARDVRASPRVLDGLSRALRLDTVKRAYLFRLARPDLQPLSREESRDRPSDALVALVKSLSPHPAYVLDVRWDIVAWNDAADFLLGGFDPLDKWSINLIGRLFTDPRLREQMANWWVLVASSVGQFRATTASLSSDPEHRALVDALENASVDFRELWRSRNLADAPNWEKLFRHPDAGEVRFRYASLQPQGVDNPFRVTIYTPASEADARRFAEALSAWRIGRQRVADQEALASEAQSG